MNGLRCNYLCLETEEVKAIEGGAPIRIPVRRCLLAEQMANLLSQTAEGRSIIRRMALPQGEGASSDESGIDIARLRMAFGPDLQAVTPQICTVDRCMESCAPGFKELLVYFGSKEHAERKDFHYPAGTMPTPSRIPDGSDSGNG